MKVSKNILENLVNRLKIGNRRGVHLNILPGKSRYKFDLFNLKKLNDDLPSEFIENLLSKNKFNFKISPKKGLKRDEEESLELNKIVRKLQNLINHVETIESEKGLNSFGFGFPTLVFKSNSDNRLVFSPLLIWSLRIKNLNEINSFQIIKNEDDPIYVNEVLINYLESDSNIKLNHLSSDMLEDGLIDSEELTEICNNVYSKLNSEKSVDSYSILQNIEKLMDKKYYENKLGSNVPQIINSGLFSIYEVQKQNLINDYKYLSDNLTEIDIESFTKSDFQSISSIKTDPSQQNILNSLSDKRNLIIQGPPGTGKSQSLTGVLINSLENNKKTLVVCEKRTALEVLQENLKNFNLERNCILIKDSIKDRRNVVDRVRERLEYVKYKNHYYDYSNTEYETKLKSVNQLIQIINSSHKSLGVDLFNGYSWSDLVGLFLNSRKKDISCDLDLISIFNDIHEINLQEYQNLLDEFEFKYRKVKKETSAPSLSSNKLNSENIYKTEKEIIQTITEYSGFLSGEKSWFENLEKKHQKNLDFFNFSKTKSFGYRFSSLFSSKRKNIINDQKKYLNILTQLLDRFKSDDVLDYNQISSLVDLDYPIETIQKLKTFSDEISNFYIKNKNKIIDEMDWFSSFEKLNDEEKKLINSLKEISNWSINFTSNLFEKLLDLNVKNDLPIDFSPQKKLTALLSEIKELQLEYINDLWFSNLVDSSRRFYHQKGIMVENLYNKRSSKRFKRNSLRQIVKSDINLFTDFFPIVLTTPDVASNLFGMMENSYFDIVLFDEASQLRIEDTLPSILKGKQIIVAGDEHQMPPSNYFSKIYEGSDEDDLEDDNEKTFDTEGFLLGSESLLEFSSEYGFNKCHLDFHYRSRHPDLIQFSNYAFYEGRLKPMMNIEDYNPISFKNISGVYTDNTNHEEAKYVIKIIDEKIKKLPSGDYPSVGIATFNISQRDLIIDEILQKRRDPSSKEFNLKMIELEKQGFFVKNLENIQGDERDVIILSTTYGVNQEGKFAKRFGQINQQKGYKLLNVIITRAKHKLYVCTSIPEKEYMNFGELIDKEGSNNRYPVFYAYLTYCKSISEGNLDLKKSVLNKLSEKTSNTSKHETKGKSQMIDFIFNQLNNSLKSHEILKYHKISEFEIDILIQPKNENSNKFIIEVDGNKEHLSSETYLNDLYREEILSSFGFQIIRTWSINWWRNPESELQDLIYKITNPELNFENIQEPKISSSFLD